MTHRRAFLAGTMLTAAFATPAMAQDVRSRVDVSLSGAYDTNPFLEQGADNDGASVVIQVDPQIYLEDETTTISITGGARYAYFPGDERNNDTLRVGLAGTTRTSEKVSVNSNLQFQTSRSAALNAVFDTPSVLGEDGSLPEPPVIDPTIVGDRGRATSLSLGAGAEISVSPTASVSAGLNSRWTGFEDLGGEDYTLTRGDLAYTRALSETVSFEVTGSAAIADYRGRALGDAVIFDAAAGMRIKVSPSGVLQFDIGASVVDVDYGPLGTDTNTILGGTVSYCDAALRGSLCINASRSARPTGRGGISTVTSAGVGWSSRVSEFDYLSLSVRYSRANQGDFSIDPAVDPLLTELWGVSASYRRQLNERISLFISPSYSDTSGSFGPRDGNLAVTGGVTFTIGSIR